MSIVYIQIYICDIKPKNNRKQGKNLKKMSTTLIMTFFHFFSTNIKSNVH